MSASSVTGSVATVRAGGGGAQGRPRRRQAPSDRAGGRRRRTRQCEDVRTPARAGCRGQERGHSVHPAVDHDPGPGARPRVRISKWQRAHRRPGFFIGVHAGSGSGSDRGVSARSRSDPCISTRCGAHIGPRISARSGVRSGFDIGSGSSFVGAPRGATTAPASQQLVIVLVLRVLARPSSGPSDLRGVALSARVVPPSPVAPLTAPPFNPTPSPPAVTPSNDPLREEATQSEPDGPRPASPSSQWGLFAKPSPDTENGPDD